MKNNEADAKVLCEAIKRLAENDFALENLECYLSHHFDKWLDRFANTPEKLTWELDQFSRIDAE